MRKWIAGLLALTALSPVAASAQDVEGRAEAGWRGGARAEARVDADDAPRPERRDRAAPDRPQRGPDAGSPDRGARPDGARFDRGGSDARPDRQRDFDRGERDAAGDRGDRGGWRQRPEGPGSDRAEYDRPGGPRPGGDLRPDPRTAPDGGGGDRGPGWQRSDDRRPDRVGQRDRRGASLDRGPDRRPGRDDDWRRSRLDDRSRFDDRAGWGGVGIGIGSGNRGGWDRGWRSDRRYDWNRYRVSNRDAFRLPRYYAPYGWSGGYRRFAIGVGLSASLWSRSYWIDDPYAYRLPEAYGPYRWVRYYDDALLVDIRTGVVVDAAYGIFW